MQADDDRLVKRSREGDLDAFEELVKRYESKVYSIAYRFMGNHADASDLAQEAFIRVYQALPTFRGESSFATWMYRITANACRDEIRKQQRHKNLYLEEVISQTGGRSSLAAAGLSPEESLERCEIHDLVQRQLNGLSGDHRLILVMREIEGMSYEEIAASLDCTLGTVKSRLNRARQALKQKVLEQRELFDIEFRLPGKSKEG
ncbi:MAG: sigma-70 family RNA polymerase sigma factor [Peptococcaceae bacterium]|nr:sigma-70 family RNA polymerase sigma factor [Peptococcaceae bacterium]